MNVAGTFYRDDIMQSDDDANTPLGFKGEDAMYGRRMTIRIESIEGPDFSREVVCPPGQGGENASGTLPELYITVTELDELADPSSTSTTSPDPSDQSNPSSSSSPSNPQSSAGTAWHLGMPLFVWWPVVLATGC